MPVFYITINVYGLNFDIPIYGGRKDYTKSELDEIYESHRERIKQKLRDLGYTANPIGSKNKCYTWN